MTDEKSDLTSPILEHEIDTEKALRLLRKDIAPEDIEVTITPGRRLFPAAGDRSR
jgi:hypothetical protein